ncbi:hypothetical protein ZIOFF_000702 [Zingiber officinale]|uniref:Serine/threonine-protein phosphatase 2A activator n=1 Tax=Zingiber officinale TaxID=94328 RepID=A0A8J5LRK4_ZINOF|nr:hypothetical protein ZIOFF_000702 [Zingiber officinale]
MTNCKNSPPSLFLSGMTDPGSSSGAPPPSSPGAPSMPVQCSSCIVCGGTAASGLGPPLCSNCRLPPTPAIDAPMATPSVSRIPVPQPLPVPLAEPPYHFHVPWRRISSPNDIRRFDASTSGRHFLGFIAALSHSVCGRKLSDPVPSPLSDTVIGLLSLLQTLTRWIDEFPPLAHALRICNPAYRFWHARLTDKGYDLVLALLAQYDELRPAADELLPYLLDSFGNVYRIDYGNAHENNFAAFLYCLARLGLIKEEDYPALVLGVFSTYLDLMRRLQIIYNLKPDGGHGGWALDDYHFLPFIFGSAQLIDHKYMKPNSIHNDDILDYFSTDYMYLACVAFVKKVKKGVFAEHSFMLDGISGAASWKKVNIGMLRLYKGEVLEQVSIMKHFLFGSLIRWYLRIPPMAFPILVFCPNF